jgi:F-type H+/Na+-transporting ATPase subunit alpha
MSIFAANSGYLDDVPIREVARFEKEYLNFMRDQKTAVRNELAEKKELSDSLKQSLRDTLVEFKRSWKPQSK